MVENQCIHITKNAKYELALKAGKKNVITFFTPTYNRARFLPRIEECLINQTSKDFVWIVVNDGSKDNTDEVVSAILKKENLPVLLISKPNGGKHSAFRAALEQCETTYFQCMDDDDIYFPNAVEFFLNQWKIIKDEGKDEIGAIRTLSRYPNGRYSVNFVVEEGAVYDASTIETYYIMRRKQENWTCYDTAKLKSVDLFKSYWMCESHKFVAESIWQTRFARKYKCRYINDAFREYRDDDLVSLSREKKSDQHYLDVFLNTKVTLDEQYDLIRKYCSIKEYVKKTIIVNILRRRLSIPLTDLLSNTSIPSLKRAYIYSLVPSFIIYLFVKL